MMSAGRHDKLSGGRTYGGDMTSGVEETSMMSGGRATYGGDMTSP